MSGASKKNLTGRKAFDRLESDPRISSIWDEGKDGYWIKLAPGYTYEGCSAIHEWSVKDALACLPLIQGPR